VTQITGGEARTARQNLLGCGVNSVTLISVLRKARPGAQLNEHLEHKDGDVVFRHAWKRSGPNLHCDCGHTADTGFFSKSPDRLKLLIHGAPEEIRTPDPQIRSLMIDP
jgi:hypothetical protein